MQRNGFNYAVETYHGNHSKQCISETEREVEFYRHDQRGVACHADEVHKRCLQRRGWPPVLVPLLFDKQQTSKHNKYNAQTHELKVETLCMCHFCVSYSIKKEYIANELQIQTPI